MYVPLRRFAAGDNLQIIAHSRIPPDAPLRRSIICLLDRELGAHGPRTHLHVGDQMGRSAPERAALRLAMRRGTSRENPHTPRRLRCG